MDDSKTMQQQQQQNLESDDDDDMNDDEDMDMDEVINKCRSAPVSPTRQMLTGESTNQRPSCGIAGITSVAATTAAATTSSFIYDMNLYNDPNRVLLNNADEFNKCLMRLRKNNCNNNNNKTSKSCHSSTSSFASIKLEPLVINEDDNKTVSHHLIIFSRK